MPRKRTTSNNFGKPDTALDAKQRAIKEQEAKLRAQMDKYQKMIEEAPRLAAQREKVAAERERVRREQYLQRAAHAEARFGATGRLPDRRYDLNVGLPARQRRLRQERNRGRMMFFVLLLVFGAVATWFYFTVMRGG